METLEKQAGNVLQLATEMGKISNEQTNLADTMRRILDTLDQIAPRQPYRAPFDREG